MLTQIVPTKLEIAHVAACDPAGVAARAKPTRVSLDSEGCFIDAIFAILVPNEDSRTERNAESWQRALVSTAAIE
jgi:hypothetical protein